MKVSERPLRIVGVVAGMVLSLIGGYCFFDADLPLRNDTPAFDNVSEIERTLLYPESTVCTLTVSDRNDSVLTVGIIPGDSPGSTTDTDDTPLMTDWPGSCRWLSGGYGEKQLVLEWASATMGLFTGRLFLTDAQGAAAVLPYIIRRQFTDPFDGRVAAHCWQWYSPEDSSHIDFDYIDGKLVFTFTKQDDDSAGRHTTGMRSGFSLPGDFSIAVDFKLRDEMDEAFDVGFFVSTSADTGRWSGERAGMFISGTGGRLRFECRSVDLQSYSFETSATGGVLGIRRYDSTVTYFFHDGNPSVEPKPLVSQKFPVIRPVVVHLKMTVEDSFRDRNCYWNDFIVTEGTMRFSEE